MSDRNHRKPAGRGMKLLILMILLAAAMLAYVGISKWSESDGTGDSENGENYASLLSFSTDDAVKLSWSYEGEAGTESYTLEKAGSIWVWDEDPDMILDQEAVESLLQSVAALECEQPFSADETDDLSQYGMDQPVSRIKVHFDEESGLEPVVLLTGDYNYTVYGYYTMVEGTNLIGMTDGSHTDLFMQTPMNLEYIEETA